MRSIKTPTSQEKAQEFLKISRQFQLGHLQTEAPHPETHNLSMLACSDPDNAVEILKRAELKALKKLLSYTERFESLRLDIRKTLEHGGRIFIGGCGATGRLALCLEYLWRSQHRETDLRERVVGFMAGGDYALVRSIEGFEDVEAYGARQLKELGFGKKDLFIGCSEGGETPFVISATETAAVMGARATYFVYCNPDRLLVSIERSQRVIENEHILKLSLDVGPMSLSGSTRLQACTAMMLSVGEALLLWNSRVQIGNALESYIAQMDQCDYRFLKPFVEAEAKIYQEKGFILYRTDRFGITILTDTTERTPTFSLIPFENSNDSNALPSLCYVSLEGCTTSDEAWAHLLGRAPRAIEWPDLKGMAGRKALLGFDFSESALKRRKKLTHSRQHHVFRIGEANGSLIFELAGHRSAIPVSSLDNLQQHVFLKTALNAHSNVVMGKLGRYLNNIMIWVRPSNNKLVDRAIRYVSYLLQKNHHIDVSYEELALALFEVKDQIRSDESVVLRLYEQFSAASRGG